MSKYRLIKPPPELFLREFHEDQPGVDGTGFKEYNDLIRYRLGLITDYLNELYIGIDETTGGDTAECCTCFRWVWTTQATTHGQTDFYPPLPDMLLEDNEYQLVFVRSSFQYWGDLGTPRDYTIDTVNNRLIFPAGVPLGGLVTVYAVRHNDIQEVFYEECLVPAAPYAFSPPVTIDRNAGRQLLFARHSPRFLDSGRPGDEYTVSNTANTMSLTSGLGGVGVWAAMVRLMECGTLWHEEILATTTGQTVFRPAHQGNVVKPHDVGKMMVFARTSYLHPGVEYRTDVVGNTIEIDAPGLAVGQPLNCWTFR